MLRLFLLYLVMIVLASCGFEERSSLQANNDEILSKLESDLDKENIEYTKSGRNTVIVNKKDYNRLVELYRKAFEVILPPNRHSSSPLYIHNAKKEALDEMGYSYTTICYEGREVIVWGEESSQEIKRILDEVSIQTIERLKSHAVMENEELDLGGSASCNE